MNFAKSVLPLLAIRDSIENRYRDTRITLINAPAAVSLFLLTKPATTSLGQYSIYINTSTLINSDLKPFTIVAFKMKDEQSPTNETVKIEESSSQPSQKSKKAAGTRRRTKTGCLSMSTNHNSLDSKLTSLQRVV